MQKKLFAIPFTDNRDRKHVASVLAETPEEALDKMISFQSDYHGVRVTPDVRDVREIEPDEEYPVQIIWCQDYD